MTDENWYDRGEDSEYLKHEIQRQATVDNAERDRQQEKYNRYIEMLEEFHRLTKTLIEEHKILPLINLIDLSRKIDKCQK